MVPPRFAPTSLPVPIVQAPLAGGPSTPALAAAVSGAGGLGFVATGAKRVHAVSDDLAAVRAATSAPFGVNVFAPRPDERPDEAGAAAYAERLAPEAERYGVTLGVPRAGADEYAAKLELLLEERPAVVSFTFAPPARDVVDRLHDAGVAVWITVNDPDEAVLARDAGADALIAQGSEAGGHRGGFQDEAPGDIGLLALLQLVHTRVDLPLVAAGGITTGAGVAAALAAGAVAAQLGSAFMLTPEAGTSEPHRDRLAAPGRTAVTRAFSGRSARGIVNRFHAEHTAAAPRAFPHVNFVTAPLGAAGDPDAMNLWAGQAHELARAEPAAEVVERLAAEARAALADAAARLRGGA